MIIPIIESNLKIQCQYVLLKARKYFLWISYDAYCLKVSLSKKIILSQFSQKEITIFFLFKWNQKQKIEKQKKEKSYLQFVSPTLISKKKCSWWTYFGEETKNCDFWLSLAICQNFFFNFIKYKLACTILLKKTKTYIFEIFLIFLKLKTETKNKHAYKLTFLSTMFSKEYESNLFSFCNNLSSFSTAKSTKITIKNLFASFTSTNLMCGVCGFNSIWASSDAFEWLTRSSIILIISPCEQKSALEVVESAASSLTKLVTIVDASAASSNIDALQLHSAPPLYYSHNSAHEKDHLYSYPSVDIYVWESSISSLTTSLEKLIYPWWVRIFALI